MIKTVLQNNLNGTDNQMRHSSTIRRALTGALFIVAAVFPAGGGAFGGETFDCPAMCEEGAKQVLAQCRANHPKDPAACPAAFPATSI